jgi:hypothetical protein
LACAWTKPAGTDGGRGPEPAWLQTSLAPTAQPSASRAKPWDPQREQASRQRLDRTEQPRFEERDLSGPRFGVTMVMGNGELYRQLKEEKMDRVLSQFGWHFEQQVVPEGGGPQFVVQFVPLLAGVEYGIVVPNATLAMGVRFPRGWEFGLGPNVMATGVEDSDDLHTSLVMALGHSFDYGGVSLPVNLAFTTNPEGNRVTLMFGYAIRRNGSS